MPWYNPTDPKQRNAGVVGVVLLALIYPYNQFYHSPRKAELEVLQDSLQTLEQRNLAAQVQAARGGGRIEETMALYERQVAKLEELIPAGEQVAELLDQISQASRQTGIRVDQWTPETPESMGFYDRQALQLSVVGEYHNVARFLADIASLPRIVRPSELHVEAYPQPQAFPQYHSPVLADFRVETYVLPHSEAPAPAPAAGSSGGSR